MKHRITGLMFFLIPLLGIAQDNDQFGLKLSGYVKTDIIYDSRQTVALRQGHFLLYPEKKLPDATGADINAKANFHILSIQTRIKGMIYAPDVLKAKTSGMFEAEFFGNIEQNINSFRLRHATMQLNWPKTELMIGQFWHAMFITDCFPGVVSFNTGAPFQPFARNPQIRLTQAFGNVKLIGTAMAEIDFMDNGPDGASTKYLRNAALPELNLKATYNWKNDVSGFEVLAGASVNYKKLVPQLKTQLNYKTDQSIEALSYMGFLKLKTPAVTFNFEYVYGASFHSMTMLGGYAVQEITDYDRYYQSYTPIKTSSIWTDIYTNGKTWQAGLFGGYTSNLGSDEMINPIVPPAGGASDAKQIYYSRGSDIAYIYRIAPRLIYNPGRLRFAAEIEYTVAAYGQPDDYGVVQNAEEVGNFRFLLGTYIFF